jgi:mRNA-degrading endonuclease RelE of RelBE toxin-antitoxin system
MSYEVKVGKQALKRLSKAPVHVKVLFGQLIKDLQEKGAILPKWKSFSKLSDNTYHAHLTYRYVACWRNEKDSIEIEVYYAGSREDAPY